MAEKASVTSRRDALKVIGLGAGAAGAAAVASGPAKALDTGATAKGAGYRETDHVATYYELARF
jgi:anaerobic selenocysteine-containing dehydrogenase